jgi:beta-carotene ketolase (CrtW type)
LRQLGWSGPIVIAWAASLLLLPLDGASLPPAGLVVAVLTRAFLQTGLFIVAHDAMHGTLLPGSPRWNDRLGAMALACYACLPWEDCRRNHHLHHRAPTSALDPDFHADGERGAVAWYLRFMAHYLTPVTLARLLGCWLVAGLLLGRITPHPLANLLLFWSLPLLLSSLQLFVVGTYLPHRGGSAAGADGHHALSLSLPPWLSFLACYHFGDHWHHHDAPQRPWYRLPAARAQQVGSAIHAGMRWGGWKAR